MEKMMKTLRWLAALAAVLLPFGAALVADNAKIPTLITGQPAFIGSPDLKPGTFRKITVADLPDVMPAHPFLGKMVPRQESTMPLAPAGFKVELYAHDKLNAPRQIRRAP